MRGGDIHIVEIERLTPAGAGAGRVAGDSEVPVDERDREIDVVVEGAYPGERVRVRIDHVSHQHRRVVGRVLEIVRAHPGRRDVPCASHHSGPGGQCGGCPLLGLDVAAQRDAKRHDVEQQHGIVVDQVIGDPAGEWNYRWSSKRVAGRVRGQVVFGSYVARSHRVASMHECRIEHPAIAACLDELTRVANEVGITVYDERRETGDLRYVWCKTDGRDTLLTLVVAREPCPDVEAMAQRLEVPASIWLSVQAGPGNAMRGAMARHLRGREALTVEIAGVRRAIGPLGFLQPNPGVISAAYRALVDGPGDPPRGPKALDLYAGVGVTTALLRKRFSTVVACEAHLDSVAAASTEVEVAPVEAFLPAQREHGPVDLVVANPPRAGMGERVCIELAALSPKRIHVMSCHASSLARDLARLEQAGYRRVGARAYDALPHTAHLELVVWLEREGD